jgi:cell division protein FtsN
MELNMQKKDTGSRIDKLLVGLIVIFVSALSFSVGVISGKGLSDKDHALKKLESTVEQTYAESEREKKLDAHEEQNVSLSDKEIEDLAKKTLDKARSEESAKHDLSTEERSVASTEASDRVAHEKTPSPIKPEAKPRAPQSLPKIMESVVAEYTVQIASYPTMPEAQKHADSLAEKGFPAYPVKATVNGTAWYRVSIGSFKNRKTAMDYRSDLLKQDVVKEPIVQQIIRE